MVFTVVALLTAAGAPVASAQMNMQMPAMETRDEIAPDQLPPPEKLTGIGNAHMQITATPEAQMWFDQGLNLLHDYWDYESARAFEQSVRVDPQCAMCYWGLYRAESFYHGTSQGYAGRALAKSVELEKRTSKRERFYIDASAAAEAARKKPRNPQDPPPSHKEEEVLRKLVKKYPKDLQAQIFLANAIGIGSDEGLRLLEGVMKDDPQNSAANHYYIHALEASEHPERALHSAEILASLAPASGHMVHMPGHIFFRVGDYARAEQSFDASLQVDEDYMRAQHVAVDDDWNYVHNLMFAIANAMEEGKLQKATALSAKVPGARGELDTTLYLGSTRDSISRLNPQLPVALRTANWARVIELSNAAAPPATHPNLRFLAAELSAFAEGMLAIDANDAPKAQSSSTRFDAELWRASQRSKAESAMKDEANKNKANVTPDSTPLKLQLMPDAQLDQIVRVLSVMSLELRASILAIQHQGDEAKKLFAQAAQTEKDLGYREPPAYIRPVGETEAAALMAIGDWAGANEAYKRALVERPHSGFSLYGLAITSEKSGDATAALKEYGDFLAAWNAADSDLPQVSHARAYVAEHKPPTAIAHGF